MEVPGLEYHWRYSGLVKYDNQWWANFKNTKMFSPASVIHFVGPLNINTQDGSILDHFEINVVVNEGHLYEYMQTGLPMKKRPWKKH